MDKRTDSGVSPVIGTFLLLALSVVMITLVTISVMGIMGSYTPVYERSVGFTIDVNSSNDSALITPVSGTDLPFLQSYDVYTDNGHWYSPSPGGVTVDKFNSTVTFINIVGHFPEYVNALVFSGKVAVEGGVIVVVPAGGGYYVVGTDGYNTTTEFADSFNEWYNTYYNTGLNPGDPGYDVVTVSNKDLEFSNENPIIVGDQPIELSPDNIHDLSTGNIKILIKEGGNIVRAPGYYDALLQIGNASDHGVTQVTIEKKAGAPFTLNGSNIDGVTSPLIMVTSKGSLVVQKDATLIVENNLNVNGDGFGGGIYVANNGELVVSGTLRANSNSAKYGGGIYKASGGSVTTQGTGNIIYSGNTAVIAGPNIYNAL
ncbi:hypothetical protein SDC9_23816 [bioreactor metagenome]|uniref:Archaeal Type IV pilin N-terminal domain-containing protein n=1 Tax=bioreactor metagenome TaxID=1076179 RepID=A0A644UG42_9ZZZZ|nr:type IV pilin [Methanocorpusculum sp.]